MGAYPRIQWLGPPGAIKKGQARAEWNTFQAGLLRACFLPGVSLVVATTAVRTGKTGVQAAFHRHKAKRNPGVRGIWLVESYKWYKRVALPVCRQLFGHEAIWHGTDHTWTWPGFNNAQVVICTYVDLQSMQGVTAGWGSIDEYQNVGIDAYTELEQRISDARADPCVLITGLPEFGSWADQLAEEQQAVPFEQYAPGCKAVTFEGISTDVNARNIHAEYLARLAERLDPDEFKRRIKGLKPMPEGRVFNNWVPQLWDEKAPLQGGNLIDWNRKAEYTTVLDIDFGVRRGACLETQIDKVRDLEVWTDEFNLDNTDTRSLCIQLRKLYVARAMHKDEPFKRPLDLICCDPAGNSPQTAEGLTDIKILREYFPGVPIKYTYNGRLRLIPVGIKLCQARILSASGKRRQLMDVRLWDKGLKDRRTGDGYNKDKRGRSMALALLRTEYPKDKAGKALSEEPVECPVDSHCVDAWRYGTINRHGLATGGQFDAR